MYIAAFDGGGTKTHCIIGDLEGNILGLGQSGPANYQTVGQERARESLEIALSKALSKANLKKEDLVYYSFGLAGADDDYDIKNIQKFVGKIADNIPYSIHHDSFIGLRSVSKENIGVVAICGTGAGFSGRSRSGEEIQLRNQSYELGNYGGGSDISSQAMHYAFRSNEGTCKKTLLEEEIPKLFQVSTLDKLSELIRENNYMIDEKTSKLIPPLVFHLANQDDEIAKEILCNMGNELANYTIAVINKLGIKDEVEVPIVLVGSIYNGESPYLVEAMKKRVKEVVKNPKFIKPDLPPVYGAYYLVLDKKDELIK